MNHHEGSFQHVLQRIKDGKDKQSLWIPIRYPSLRYEMGITKRLYHLFGGDPGSGKTSFVDTTYVLDAHTWLMKNHSRTKLKTIYFSMERSQVDKKMKWIAYKLFREDGILRSVPDLSTWGTAKNPVTDELISVIESHGPFFDDLFEQVHVIDGKTNPTGIYKTLWKIALEHGTVYGRDEEGRYYKITYQSYINDDPDKRSMPITKEECPVDLKRKYDKQYIPDDPDLIIQVVLDHIGKVKSERGMNDKQIIDKTSEYLGELRDFFGMAVVVIQQFNRNNADMRRRVNTDLTPEPQDFKGSANTYEDADLVLGLFSPYKHGLSTYKGYQIGKTKQGKYSRFRSVTLMKNSYGADNLISVFRFVGECGAFDQITATPNEINYEEVFKI